MKRMCSFFLALVVVFTMSMPAALAASNPTDIANHMYRTDIQRLDNYGAISSLVSGGRFDPDRNITQSEFCAMVTALFPGHNLGITTTSTNQTDMYWACQRLQTAGLALGYSTGWSQVTTEVLTRARAVHLICLWLDSNAGLNNMVGKVGNQVQTQSQTQSQANSFYGPDGALYDISSGYSQAQSGWDGFWLQNNGLWYIYRSTANNVNNNTQYGYWSGGKWWSYNYNSSTGSNSNNGSNYNPFRDVQSGAYYYDAIIWAYNRGIATGTSSYTFSPERTCTQAEVLTLIWRMYGSPSSLYPCPISGINSGAYYYSALCWASEKNMVSAAASDGMDPSTVSCTRAMCVYYLWRAAGSPNVTSNSCARFTDVATASPYRMAISWAIDRGITSGTSSNTFSPLNTVTRGEVVTFMYRAYGVR